MLLNAISLLIPISLTRLRTHHTTATWEGNTKSPQTRLDGGTALSKCKSVWQNSSTVSAAMKLDGKVQVQECRKDGNQLVCVSETASQQVLVLPASCLCPRWGCAMDLRPYLVLALQHSHKPGLWALGCSLFCCWHLHTKHQRRRSQVTTPCVRCCLTQSLIKCCSSAWDVCALTSKD